MTSVHRPLEPHFMQDDGAGSPFSEPVLFWSLSPRGRYLAVFVCRTADDLVVRERVWVYDTDTFERVARLDGPLTFRSMAWADDEQLVVLRDRDESRDDRTFRRAVVQLMAIPDGGTLAECELTQAGHMRTDLTVSADARTLLVSPYVETGNTNPTQAFLLTLPTLDLLQTLTLREAAPNTFGVRSTGYFLDAEGQRLARTDEYNALHLYEREGRALVLTRTEQGVSRAYCPVVTWFGRDRMWIAPRDHVKPEECLLLSLDDQGRAHRTDVSELMGFAVKAPRGRAGLMLQWRANPAQERLDLFMVGRAVRWDVGTGRAVEPVLFPKSTLNSVRAVRWLDDTRALVLRDDAGIQLHTYVGGKPEGEPTPVWFPRGVSAAKHVVEPLGAGRVLVALEDYSRNTELCVVVR